MIWEYKGTWRCNVMGKTDLDSVLKEYGELHELLCDYDQEQCFIDRIYSILQDVINELPDGSKIGFRPYGDQSEWLLQNFDFSRVEVVGVFDRCVDCDICQGFPVYEISNDHADEVDIFIMTSYNYRHEITTELRKSGCKVLDIYESLEQRGIRLLSSPEKYRKGAHNILHAFLTKWKNADEGKKEEAFRELLTAACEAKDFYLLEELCRDSETEYEWVKKIKDQYERLHASLRDAVGKRRQKDIVMYWLDAIPHQWRTYFAGLHKLAETGLCFEQAYSCTPYTHQASRAIFSGLLPLSDCEKSLEQIGRENSGLIQYLENRDYKIRHIGHDAPTYEEGCLQREYSMNTNKDTSCNDILWRTVCEMIGADAPVFLIAHFVVETHPPMLCAALEQLNYVVEDHNYLPQFRVSADYIDKRVMYYYGILKGNDRLQIFMSDHGEHTTKRFPDRYWSQHKLHACCFAVGKGICPQREKRIFFYTRFEQLIRWMIEPDRNRYEDCLSEYALFQDTDIYSEMLANRFIRKGRAQYALAYRGALDGKYKYAVNAIGQEFFYQIVDDKDIEVKKEDAPEIFQRLMEQAGSDFPDLSGYEKYRFVPRLYEAAKREG